MAGSKNEGCWKSNLEFHCQDDQAQNIRSEVEVDGNQSETSVGPFMCKLFEKQQYTDVEFVSKGTKESISAHRVVVAAKCPFFENLLFGQKKNEAVGMKMEVELSNIAFGVFKDVVKYFYTGYIEFADDPTVLEIYEIAQSFEIQPLIGRCEGYIDAMELTEDNVCSTLQISNAKNCDLLKNRCIDYIKKNTFEVISSPDFEKCSYNTIREICDLQDINLESELRILEACLRWINVQPDHTKRDLKKSLIKCIRFLSFSPQELGDSIKQYPDLLNSDEALTILMYLNNPKSGNMKELPHWVNKSQRSFSRGFQRDASGSIRFPLKPASEPLEMTELTSVVQMRCIKGTHDITGVKISLGHSSIEEDPTAVLVVKALVMPRRHGHCFSKTVDSGEMLLKFDRSFFVRKYQVFHLKVEIKACRPLQFLQFHASENDLENEHFVCSLSSRPKRGRFFIIQEIMYGPYRPFQPHCFSRQFSKK